MARALGELYVRRRAEGGVPPSRILLDFDATDDPAHGEQEGTYYHGYYRTRMYHPLLVFDGETDQLITAVLRPGNTHASRGALAILSRIVGRLREAWPAVEIEIRADAGFAVPEIYEYCEKEGIDYTIGLISNPRLEGIAQDLLERAKRESLERDGQKVRLLSDASYQANSWERSRRVIYKAEVLQKGENTRFVVSTRTDRLSCHRFLANQFRLLLHAAAYWLLDELRRRLVGTGMRRMQLDTLRLYLIKIGGRVRELLTKVRLHLASGHPGQLLWNALASPPAAVS